PKRAEVWCTLAHRPPIIPVDHHDAQANTDGGHAMRIGFIGLGNMGGPMALNVLKAGHTMVVNDIRRDMAAPHLRQGATWADTPKAVAEQSELTFTSLPGPREVEAVALGENGIIEG